MLAAFPPPHRGAVHAEPDGELVLRDASLAADDADAVPDFPPEVLQPLTLVAIIPGHPATITGGARNVCCARCSISAG